MRRGRQIATVAIGIAELAVRLYWMWRNGRTKEMSSQFGSPGQPGTAYGMAEHHERLGNLLPY